MPILNDMSGPKADEIREIMYWCKDCARNACKDWSEAKTCRHCLWVMLRQTSEKVHAFNSEFMTNKPYWWKSKKELVVCGDCGKVVVPKEELQDIHPDRRDEVCECQKRE